MMIDTKALRQKIIELAVSGKLVPQDPSDEPAAVLLERIKQEKSALIKQGKLKAAKADSKDKQNCDSSYYENLPNGWAVTTIGFITILTSGADLQKSKFRNNPPGIPYVTGASNFSDGLISINRYVDSSFKNSAFGDVFLTCKGTIGEIAINQIGDCHVARQIMSLRPFIDCDFLVLLLQNNISKYKEEGRSQIPGIGRKNVLTTKVVLPPLKEQSRIAAKVASIFQVLASLQKAQDRYQKLRGLLKAKILSLAVSGRLLSTENTTIKSDDKNYYRNNGVNWPQKKLSDLGFVTGGGTPSTLNASYYDGGSIPWVTPIDMRNIDGFKLPTPRRFITEKGLQNSSAKIIKPGSIVMSSRAPIGYIGICDKFVATSQGCKSLTLNEGSEWSSKFVVIAIKAQLNQIIENASGTTFKEISGTEFSHIQIPWPNSENERKETVSRVEELFLSIS